PVSEQGRFYRVSERAFQRIIDFYGGTLTWVLKHQPLTLVIAVATLATTIVLYIVILKRVFAVQQTGVILGISEQHQMIAVSATWERQRSVAREIIKDPAVASLSAFIGIDGTNTTTNSGRIQINLKPLEERKASETEIIRRLQPNLAKIESITLFLQPV